MTPLILSLDCSPETTKQNELSPPSDKPTSKRFAALSIYTRTETIVRKKELDGEEDILFTCPMHMFQSDGHSTLEEPIWSATVTLPCGFEMELDLPLKGDVQRPRTVKQDLEFGVCEPTDDDKIEFKSERMRLSLDAIDSLSIPRSVSIPLIRPSQKVSQSFQQRSEISSVIFLFITFFSVTFMRCRPTVSSSVKTFKTETSSLPTQDTGNSTTQQKSTVTPSSVTNSPSSYEDLNLNDSTENIESAEVMEIMESIENLESIEIIDTKASFDKIHNSMSFKDKPQNLHQIIARSPLTPNINITNTNPASAGRRSLLGSFALNVSTARIHKDRSKDQKNEKKENTKNTKNTTCTIIAKNPKNAKTTRRTSLSPSQGNKENESDDDQATTSFFDEYWK